MRWRRASGDAKREREERGLLGTLEAGMQRVDDNNTMGKLNSSPPLYPLHFIPHFPPPCAFNRAK